MNYSLYGVIRKVLKMASNQKDVLMVIFGEMLNFIVIVDIT